MGFTKGPISRLGTTTSHGHGRHTCREGRSSDDVRARIELASERRRVTAAAGTRVAKEFGLPVAPARLRLLLLAGGGSSGAPEEVEKGGVGEGEKEKEREIRHTLW